MKAKKAAKSSRKQRESQADRFDRIYKVVRERICLLEYAPGTLLNEGLLAKEFGVSRTPMRNVLQRLNYEGLLETRNGVGTIVTDVNFKTFKDIYELRMHLAEMQGVLSPMEPAPETIEGIKSLCDRVDSLKNGSKDLSAYACLCNEFHEKLLELIGNETLREVTDLLYYRTARIWLTFLDHLDWNEEIEIMQHEISEILRVLEIGDMRGVGNIRRQYLYMMLTRISRYV